MAISIAIAYGVGWTMSWLTTILTAAFLGNRAPRPNIKASVTILLAIAIIFGVGLFMTLHFYHYPLVFAVLVALALYLNFFLAARGGSKLIVLLCTMAILLIPLVGGAEPRLALLVSQGFLISAAAALFCTQVAHSVLPGGTIQPPKSAQVADDPARSAWLSTAVILPMALVSLAFNLTGAVLPLIQISALSQKPDFSVGAAGGKALIAANLGGGVAAILFYKQLQVSPTYPFLVAGLTALALLFGRYIFSGRPTAPLYASAYSTVLILIGGGTGQFGGDTDAGFYQRIVLILLSVCYVVGALSLLQMPAVRERWMRVGRWLSVKLAST
jgi:hypothetical protein